MDSIVIKTKRKPKIELDPDHKPLVEKQVTIRSWVTSPMPVRIWPSTYLICNQTGNRSRLLYSENVGRYPQWKFLKAYERFLMVFESLPEECVTFDLYEDIPEPEEFHARNILRNQTGVYDIQL
jgi:hypothetical protein